LRSMKSRNMRRILFPAGEKGKIRAVKPSEAIYFHE
jgi:hypothetical protein